MPLGPTEVARGEVRIGVNDRGLRGGLTKAEREVSATMKKVDGMRAEPEIDADIRGLERKMAKAQKEVEAWEKKKADKTLGVNTGQANREIATLRANIRSLQDRKIKVRVEKSQLAGLMRDVEKLKVAATSSSNPISKLGQTLSGTSVRVGPLTTSVKGLIVGLSGLAPVVTGAVSSVSALVGVVGSGLTGAMAVGGAGLAGFGMAALGVGMVLKPLIGELSNTMKAQKAYDDAVRKNGKGSDLANKKLKQLHSTMGNVNNGTVDAFKKWGALKEQWKGVTKSLKPEFFNSVGSAITAASDLMPMFAGRTKEAFTSVSRGFQGWMKGLSSGGGESVIDRIFGNFNAAIPSLMSGLGSLGAALGKVFASAGRYLKPMADAFAAWAGNMNKAASNTTALDASIDRKVKSAKLLWGFFKALGSAAKTFFGAGAGEGGNMLKSMTDSLRTWDKWAKSAAGKNWLKDFFAEGRETMTALFRAIGPFIELFLQWSKVMLPLTLGALKFFEALGKIVTALLELVGVKGGLQTLGVILAGLWVGGKIMAFIKLVNSARKALMALAAVRAAVGAAAAILPGGRGRRGRGGGGAGGTVLAPGGGSRRKPRPAPRVPAPARSRFGRIAAGLGLGAAAGSVARRLGRRPLPPPMWRPPPRPPPPPRPSMLSRIGGFARRIPYVGLGLTALTYPYGQGAGARREWMSGMAMGQDRPGSWGGRSRNWLNRKLAYGPRRTGLSPAASGLANRAVGLFSGNGRTGSGLRMNGAPSTQKVKVNFSQAGGGPVTKIIDRIRKAKFGRLVQRIGERGGPVVKRVIAGIRKTKLGRIIQAIGERGSPKVRRAINGIKRMKLGKLVQSIGERGGPVVKRVIGGLKRTKLGRIIQAIGERGGPQVRKSVANIKRMKLNKLIQRITEKGGPNVKKILANIKKTKLGKSTLAIAQAGFEAVMERIRTLRAEARKEIKMVVNVTRKVSSSGGGRGRAEGGVEGYASGGLMRQLESQDLPTRDRGRSQRVVDPAYMVGEERRPEFIIATNPAYRKNNLDYWARAGNALGVPGFAKGGAPDIDRFTGGNSTIARKKTGIENEERRYDQADRRFNIDLSNSDFLDENGQRNESVISQRLTQINALVAMKQRIKQMYIELVKTVEETVRQVQEYINQMRASLDSMPTKVPKGKGKNRKMVKNERIGPLKDKIKEYGDALPDLRNEKTDAQFGITDRDLDLHELGMTREAVAGTKSQAAGEGGTADTGGSDGGDSGGGEGGGGDSGGGDTETAVQRSQREFETNLNVGGARAAMFKEFGGNVASTLAPMVRNPSFAAALGQSVASLPIGTNAPRIGSTPTASRMGPGPAGPGGGTTNNVTNNFAAPPPDPHTWVKTQRHSLEALV